MQIKIKLKIAEVIIQMQSSFALEKPSGDEKEDSGERFNNFFYRGRENPDILINVKVVDKIPEVSGGRPLFITYHFQDGRENWRLLRKNNNYIYKCPLEDKEQLVLVNSKFNKATVYLLAQKNEGWHLSDIIYDFLQVLLINYFAQRKLGFFIHAVGIKDLSRKGLIFSGKSGAGKSTLAKIWYKHSKAIVLNDDRIIVRKIKDKFYIYGSPWHGEFSDYLESSIEPALLGNLFFVHHSPENNARLIRKKDFFSLLYPVLFPTFWDKACLENTVSFALDLSRNISAYSLGFVNDKRVIEFVRKLN